MMVNLESVLVILFSLFFSTSAAFGTSDHVLTDDPAAFLGRLSLRRMSAENRSTTRLNVSYDLGRSNVSSAVEVLCNDISDASLEEPDFGRCSTLLALSMVVTRNTWVREFDHACISKNKSKAEDSFLFVVASLYDLASALSQYEPNRMNPSNDKMKRTVCVIGGKFSPTLLLAVLLSDQRFVVRTVVGDDANITTEKTAFDAFLSMLESSKQSMSLRHLSTRMLGLNSYSEFRTQYERSHQENDRMRLCDIAHIRNDIMSLPSSLLSAQQQQQTNDSTGGINERQNGKVAHERTSAESLTDFLFHIRTTTTTTKNGNNYEESFHHSSPKNLHPHPNHDNMELPSPQTPYLILRESQMVDPADMNAFCSSSCKSDCKSGRVRASPPPAPMISCVCDIDGANGDMGDRRSDVEQSSPRVFPIQWLASGVAPTDNAFVASHDSQGYYNFNFDVRKHVASMVEVRLGIRRDRSSRNNDFYEAVKINDTMNDRRTRLSPEPGGDNINSICDTNIIESGHVEYGACAHVFRQDLLQQGRQRRQRSELIKQRQNKSEFVFPESRTTTSDDIVNLHMIITYTSRLFQHNAYGFLDAVKTMQASGNINSDDFLSYKATRGVNVGPYKLNLSAEVFDHTTNAFARLAQTLIANSPSRETDKNSSKTRMLLLHVAFGCHFPAIYLENYICYQSEQPWSYILAPVLRPVLHYHTVSRVMRNSRALLTSSDMQRDLMVTLGYHRVFTTPFYTYTQGHNNKNNNSSSTDTRPKYQVTNSAMMISYETDSIFEHIASDDQKQDVCAIQYPAYVNSKLRHQWKMTQGVFGTPRAGDRLDGSYCSAIRDIRLFNPSNKPASFMTSNNRNRSSAAPEAAATIKKDLKQMAIDELSARYPVDIVMYGGCTERRIRFTQSLEEYAQQLAKEGRRGLAIRSVCPMGWSQALFDDDLDVVLNKAKIVANIHSYRESSLQVHRLMHLFSLGLCTVSERSIVDPDLDNEYADAAVFPDPVAINVTKSVELSPAVAMGIQWAGVEDEELDVKSLQDVMDSIDALLHDPVRLIKCQRQASMKYGRVQADTFELQKSIRQAVDVMITDFDKGF